MRTEADLRPWSIHQVDPLPAIRDGRAAGPKSTARAVGTDRLLHRAVSLIDAMKAAMARQPRLESARQILRLIVSGECVSLD
jgi:hypothetical protein